MKYIEWNITQIYKHLFIYFLPKSLPKSLAKSLAKRMDQYLNQ